METLNFPGRYGGLGSPPNHCFGSAESLDSWFLNRETLVPDKFDPYREALVIETHTVWPTEGEPLEAGMKQQLEQKLHANPADCSQLEYVRMHTGFCRQITVTEEDLARLKS